MKKFDTKDELLCWLLYSADDKVIRAAIVPDSDLTSVMTDKLYKEVMYLLYKHTMTTDSGKLLITERFKELFGDEKEVEKDG